MSDREQMREIAWKEVGKLRGDITTNDIIVASIDAFIAAGFGDVRAARREALEEAEAAAITVMRRELYISTDLSDDLLATFAAREGVGARKAADAIRALMDKPATDWRALCEKLAGALGDVADGAPRYIVKVHTALAAAREAGIGGDRD